MRQRNSSVVEDRQVELAKARGVGHDLNLGDLPALERELEHPQQSSPRSEDESYRSINEHRLRESGGSRERQCSLGPASRTTDFSRSAWQCCSFVDPNDDVWVEHCDEPVEVTRAYGSQKGGDEFPLPAEIAHGTRGRSPHAAARPAGKLPCCSGGASYHRSKVVKGNREQVVQHEHEPLGGSQPVQYHEQREANCVGHEGLLLRVRPGCALRNRLTLVCTQRLLALYPTAADN